MKIDSIITIKKCLSLMVILLLIITNVFAVHRENFKLCNESSFCRRMRSTGSIDPLYDFELLRLPFSGSSNLINLELVNRIDSQRYALRLTGYVDDIFQIEIREWEHQRYVVEDVYTKPEPKEFSVSQYLTNFTLRSGENSVVLHMQPFRIDFYKNEILTVEVNGRDLFKFEYTRTKPVNAPNDGTWEESFNGFPDSKPNGPQAVSMDFSFPYAEILFGIPEHADSFALNPTVGGTDPEPYRLYNVDIAEYELNTRMSLYGAVPVIYGHGPTVTAGVFWANSAETWIDIYNATNGNVHRAHFMSETGIIDVFVLLGPTPKDAFKQYTTLTGVAPLPQMFSLGYHQCRWNYYTQSDVLEVSNNFDLYDIPMDTMWLDIEYTDSKKYFTWDYLAFPNSLEMINQLKNQSRSLVVIIDPHIKRDDSYFVHQELTAAGLYTKNKDGQVFEGQCWPGLSSYPDFFNPATRNYFSYLYNSFTGVTTDVMLWNDMNEPSVFDGPEITMLKDNLHFGGWEHRDIHNLYGHMFIRTTYNSLMSRTNNSIRPFILTRSHFAGSQRYAAIWTGDNFADWNHMKMSIKMCLSEAVAGISNCGADVGGFFGDPEPELFGRWYQVGAFQPFFRGHANDSTPRREPWLYPEATRLIIRDAIRKRYSYLPMWYTLFYEHERNGLPIMRPLLTEFPKDRQTYHIDDQYLLSDILMIRPVLDPGVNTVNVYFPIKENANQSNIWYDNEDYTVYNTTGYRSIPVNNYKIPVFQRGGKILAKKELIRSTSQLMKDDPYTLVICLDEFQYGEGTVYIDDEKTFEYRNEKRYLYTEYIFNENILTNRLIDENAQHYETKSMLERIIVAGLDFELPELIAFTVNGNFMKINYTREDNLIIVYPENVNMGNLWRIDFSGAITLNLFSMVTIMFVSLIVYLIN